MFYFVIKAARRREKIFTELVVTYIYINCMTTWWENTKRYTHTISQWEINRKLWQKLNNWNLLPSQNVVYLGSEIYLIWIHHWMWNQNALLFRPMFVKFSVLISLCWEKKISHTVFPLPIFLFLLLSIFSDKPYFSYVFNQSKYSEKIFNKMFFTIWTQN